MKKLLLAVSLVFLVSPAMADRWEYDGASYKPYVSCTRDVQRRSMKWQTAIPPYDKAIFYKFKMLNWKGEVESIRTALLQWTKPKINPSTGKIQMTLNAKPLEGNTNAMISYQGGTGGGKDWGSGTKVTSNKNIPLQGRQHWFKLNTSGPERSQEYTIKISISGGCRSENVAVYGFRRVKEFIDDFSSSSDSGVDGGNVPFSGSWTWRANCPVGNFTDKLEISSFSGNHFSGMLHHGSLHNKIKGTLVGNQFTFYRTLTQNNKTRQQTWKGMFDTKTGKIHSGVLTDPTHGPCKWSAQK